MVAVVHSCGLKRLARYPRRPEGGAADAKQALSSSLEKREVGQFAE